MGQLLRCLIFSILTLNMSGCSDTIVKSFAFHPMRFNADNYNLDDSGVQDVEFTTEDQIRLHAFYLPKPDNQKLVLYFHGNFGHSLHRLNSAWHLAQTGVNVLLVGYRGYGRSEGEPSEDGVYNDAKAALRYATQELNFAPENIFVLGRSLGSAVAVDLAQEREFGGLILVGTFTSAHEVMSEAGMGWLRMFVNRRPFDQTAKLERVTSPALFIHGERDRQIPLQLAETLYQSYPSPYKSMVTVAYAGHNDIFHRHRDKIWTRIAAFIDAPQKEKGRTEYWQDVQ